MHREFRKLLDKATGISENVIAIFLDIRDFTKFCKTVNDFDVAKYLKTIYSEILDEYFQNASFYKSIGDGLIIIIPFNKENIVEISNSTIKSCLNLIEAFGSICKDKRMINFPIPKKIGIGVARGSACCITANNKILDYSGKILNLASRLMDKARPSGIVFDESFQINLLSDDIKDLFSEKSICLRSIAEETPIKVYYTKRYTFISDKDKEPIKEPKWYMQKQKHRYDVLKNLALSAKSLSFILKKKPLAVNQICIIVAFNSPKTKGFVTTWWLSTELESITYERKGNLNRIDIDYNILLTNLENQGLTNDVKIEFLVKYPII